MKTILAIVLILAGVLLFSQGFNRRESLAGRVDAVGTELANTVDAGARQPRHVMYMVSGGVLSVIGVVLLMRRTPRVNHNSTL